MEDKEVGELWAEAQTKQFGWASRQDVMELIRKLVEERAIAYQNHDREAPMYQDRIFPKYIGLALRDFVINPETWKETK